MSSLIPWLGQVRDAARLARRYGPSLDVGLQEGAQDVADVAENIPEYVGRGISAVAATRPADIVQGLRQAGGALLGADEDPAPNLDKSGPQEDRSMLGPTRLGGVTGQIQSLAKATYPSAGMPLKQAVTEAPATSIRAVRLPSGKIVFTNRASTDNDKEAAYLRTGTDVPYRDAVRAVGQQDQAAAEALGKGKMSPFMQAEYSRRARSPMVNEIPATVTSPVAEGSPTAQRAQMESLAGAATLAGLRQSTAESEAGVEEAQMSPLDRARLANKDVVALQYVEQQLIPGLAKQADANILRISTPGHPNYIEDAKARQHAVDTINEEFRRRVESLRTSAMGIRSAGF